MTATIDLNGVTVLTDLSGALIWPAAATLIVADLHLEKGSALATGGTLLPPYDSRATLDRLEDAIKRHHPRRIICLGDSFHDDLAVERIDKDDAARLRRLTQSAEWIWIAGNHDPQ
ncbi:MAG: phosphoesterase, partial [Alphaproteobacteria bacterium]|nr:phosphoesterase [Alphaproteobacteria bacterium]